MKRDIYDTRKEMQQEQLSAMNKLLASAKVNPFYKKRLSGDFSDGQFDHVKQISDAFPCLTKEEIVTDHKEFPPFGTNLTLPIEEYNHFSQTAGTKALKEATK